MFGSSEKNDTQKTIQILQSQSEVFYSALSNLQSNDFVFINRVCLRKSFIHSIDPIKNSSTGEKGSRIRYFSFELKKYEGRLTESFDFWESEITFEEIKAILQK